MFWESLAVRGRCDGQSCTPSGEMPPTTSQPVRWREGAPSRRCGSERRVQWRGKEIIIPKNVTVVDNLNKHQILSVLNNVSLLLSMLCISIEGKRRSISVDPARSVQSSSSRIGNRRRDTIHLFLYKVTHACLQILCPWGLNSNP